MGRIRPSAGNGPHFLLLPFVEQGHIIPMLNLASQLTAIDCKVTFVNALQSIYSSVVHGSSNANPSAKVASNGSFNGVQLHVEDDECMGDQLQFVTLSSTPPSAAAARPHSTSNQFEHVSMDTRHMVFKQKLAALEKLEPLIEKIVLDSKTSTAHRPISCIVCDVLLWKWVKKVSDKHAVKLAIFVPCNALAFSIHRSVKEKELEELLVSAFNMPPKDDPRRLGLFGIRDPPEVRLQKLECFKGLFEGLEYAGAHFLVNSFKHLEEPLLPFFQAAGVNMTFIAPCVGGRRDNIHVSNNRTQRAGSVLVQEEGCIAWLDRQENRSVLFVSFGSEGVLDETHVQEIAMGIEQSGCRFLWVVRPDTPTSSRPPEDFCERSRQRDTGMFVAWAPQRAVLQHASVGAFLTHNGWNSTLESLSCGVPMLCLPLIGDQPYNANLVQSYWQVGLRLQQYPTDGGQYTVSRSDVESGVRALMQGKFSDNAAHFQRKAQLAIPEAQRDLTESFIQIIT